MSQLSVGQQSNVGVGISRASAQMRCAYCRAAGRCECTELFPGQRVELTGYGAGRGATFLRYGAESWACGPNHVSTPGLRLVEVDIDPGPNWRGGATYVWEDTVSSYGVPCYVRPADRRAA